MPITVDELRLLHKVLSSSAFQSLIGAEEWDLTEQDEKALWDFIGHVHGALPPD